jgi:hypothetical protein
VVDHALHQELAVFTGDDVQDRILAAAAVGVEPGPGKIERRSRARLEVQVLLVERQRRRQVVGNDVEVVHACDRHRKSPRVAV